MTRPPSDYETARRLEEAIVMHRLAILKGMDPDEANERLWNSL